MPDRSMDAEVRRIGDERHAAARRLLRENRDRLDDIAMLMLERKTHDEPADYAAASLSPAPSTNLCRCSE